MADFAEEAAGVAEEVAGIGCLECCAFDALCGTMCSCCCGDGSASEVAEFGCLTCCIECLGCALCCRMVCDSCCCCCPCSGRGKAADETETYGGGYAPLQGAPQQVVMGGDPSYPPPQPQFQYNEIAPPAANMQNGQYGGQYGQPGVPSYGGYAPPMYEQQKEEGGGMGEIIAAGIAGAAVGALADEAIQEAFD